MLCTLVGWLKLRRHLLNSLSALSTLTWPPEAVSSPSVRNMNTVCPTGFPVSRYRQQKYGFVWYLYVNDITSFCLSKDISDTLKRRYIQTINLFFHQCLCHLESMGEAGHTTATEAVLYLFLEVGLGVLDMHSMRIIDHHIYQQAAVLETGFHDVKNCSLNLKWQKYYNCSKKLHREKNTALTCGTTIH